MAEYYDIKHQLDVLKGDLRTIIQHPQYSLPFLQPGRLVTVRHGDMNFGWACVVNANKRVGPRGSSLPDTVPPQESYIVDVLVHADIGAANARPRPGDTFSEATGIRPCPPGVKGEYVVVPAMLSTIESISQIRLFLPKDLKPPQAREQMYKNVREVQRRFPAGIGLLDPVENMGIKDKEFKHLLRKIQKLEVAQSSSKLHKLPELPPAYHQYVAKQEFASQIKAIKRKIAAAHSIIHLDELKYRKRVLRRLEFTTNDDVVQMKGRVACEISTGDEVSVVFVNNLSWLNCCAALAHRADLPRRFQ